MEGTHLFDPASAALVILGTIAATVLRCGWRDTLDALRALCHLFTRSFDAKQARAELAVHVQEIEADGLLRAEPHHYADGELDDLTAEMIRTRSIKGIHKGHEAHRERRMEVSRRASGVFAAAAELAPVLGLAGTLISLGGLSSGAAATEDFAAAIGMAVATTFYGLITANFLFAPLSAIVARRAEAEDRAREEVIEWLASAVDASLRRHPERERDAA